MPIRYPPTESVIWLVSSRTLGRLRAGANCIIDSLIAGSEATKYRVSTTMMSAPETAVAIPAPILSRPPDTAAMFAGLVMNVSKSVTRVFRPGPKMPSSHA